MIFSFGAEIDRRCMAGSSWGQGRKRREISRKMLLITITIIIIIIIIITHTHTHTHIYTHEGPRASGIRGKNRGQVSRIGLWRAT